MKYNMGFANYSPGKSGWRFLRISNIIGIELQKSILQLLNFYLLYTKKKYLINNFKCLLHAELKNNIIGIIL